MGNLQNPSKRTLTKTERHLREGMLMNAAEEVVYRRNRFWDAEDAALKPSIVSRRHREYMRACEALIEVGSSRISDGYLRLMGGEKAVDERDKLLGAGADVVPFKRGGRPG